MKQCKNMFILPLVCLILSCNDAPKVHSEKEFNRYEIPNLEKPVYYSGIPLLTCDMAKYRLTEMNSEYVIRNSNSVVTSANIRRNGYNSVLSIEFDEISGPNDHLEFVVSAYGKLTDKSPIPKELSGQIIGASFRAVSMDIPIELTLEALNYTGEIIDTKTFSVEQDSMRLYSLSFSSSGFKQLLFRIEGEDQTETLPVKGALVIDDVYLLSDKHQLFLPPVNEVDFLAWLKESSIRYFHWNYKEVNGNQGIVLEAAGDNTKVSLSGLGYALAIFILAEKENIIGSTEAKQKILSILKWLQAQNWFNGSGGWKGFPHHYFKPDGTNFWPDVSTIDWAMCAAGIRVARQYYSGDPEIVSIATELLDRPEWDKAIGTDNRIAMGFNGSDGTMNNYRWGLAFSEETELVYLEALASGKISEQLLDDVIREKESGFYPSWFGAGFTYNWLQLWTGPIEPYKTNSTFAFQQDASTCRNAFGINIMGLTACETMSGLSSSGFIKWDRYISNQGSDISGASRTEVIQLSPAPYGAALALPFTKNEALEALHAFTDIGFYHPLLGLPDNVRLDNLPEGISPSPNWNPFDINTGPIALSIEQTQGNQIGQLYQKDKDIEESLQKLIQSFTY